MTAELFFFINVVLLSRLILLFEDHPQRVRTLVKMVLIQACGLAVFALHGVTALLLASVIVINGLCGFLEHKFTKRWDALRILSLFALLLVANVFFAPAVHLQFNTTLVEKMRAATQYLLFLNPVTDGDMLKFGMLLAGWLFVLNEANIIIRAVLTWVRIGPPAQLHDDTTPPPDKGPKLVLPDGVTVESADGKKELNTGRIIGLLERTIIYVLVLLNQFTAIAFVLTAKSFARYKALDDREFAEYVLVGTLLSSAVAIFAGMTIRWLLP
jgi:hypothetical protein